MIWNAVLKLTWFIFVQGPLGLIAAFNSVLEYLTGGIITDMLFGSANEFQWNNIPLQFWWFVLFAFCLFSLVFTIQMIILVFKEAIATKTKFVLALQNGVKAFIFMFLIPIFFFLANFIVQNVANTIINSFGYSGNLAQYLWHIGDPNWDGSPDGVPNDYSHPPISLLNKYNMIAQIFGTWFMLIAIFIIGIILIQKIVELFFLFVISPIVMIAMVIDDGKAAFTWKDMIIAKFLASSATLIGYYIFISATQVLLSSGLNGLAVTPIAKSLFIILFLSGGAMATLAFSDMVSSFLGEAVGIREGMASMKSTMAGGMMAVSAGKMAMKGIGFAHRKRGPGFASNGGSFAENIAQEVGGEAAGLNFSTFHNANKSVATRTGIIGLTGLALGAAAVGFSKYRATTSAIGGKASFKKFGRGIGTKMKKTVTHTREKLTPNVIKTSKEQISAHRKEISAKQIDLVANKIDKQKQLIKQYQKTDPNLVAKANQKLTKLQKEKLKLYQRKAKFKIPNEKNKFERKQEKRERWEKKQKEQNSKAK